MMMKRLLYPMAALATPLLVGADRAPLPPIDVNPPAKLEKATFALG
jgi:hypothetical protein